MVERRQRSGAANAASAPQETKKGFEVSAKVFELEGSTSNLVAFVDYTFSVDGQEIFVVKGSRILEGSKGLFVAMPSKKVGDEYKDLAFPITKDFREQLQKVALDAYDGLA